MDTPVLFDTHASVKRLITAGLTESIAEALVEEQQKWHNTNLANLATKQDVESLRQEMTYQFVRVDDRIEATRQEVKQDVELLRQEVKQDVELLRQEVKIRTDSLTDQITNLKWLIGLMFGVLLAFNGFMLAIIKFL